ncbi:MAG TPA: zf-HC2 domain-containing protein [Vicinamibacterales bacterium]|nr:zf-HC2 domain-containing protein [Vicinamibacterales bacterium]
MRHQVPCASVRAELSEYHDGELSIDAQILIQSHLQACVACRLEAAALADLGDALRTMAGSVPGRSAADTGVIAGAVLDRVRVEQQQSLSMQVRTLFEDMHWVWAGLGATAALVFCVVASAGVLHAASDEKPESLAGIITALANQGSNDNPVQLADTMSAPRALFELPMPVSEHDAELALSAVVTREGRIQNLAVLAEQAAALHVKPEVLIAMLQAASRARFAPAISGGLPVAVNVVWLVTSTTVKGRPDYDLYLLAPPRRPSSQSLPSPLPVAKRPPAPVKSPAAGDDGLTAV